MTVVIFQETTCQNHDALEMVSALAEEGVRPVDLTFKAICLTTSQVLAISNRPDGSWGGPKTKVLAALYSETPEKLSDLMRSYWEKDPTRAARYPAWIKPYMVSTEKQSGAFAAALKLKGT